MLITPAEAVTLGASTGSAVCCVTPSPRSSSLARLLSITMVGVMVLAVGAPVSVQLAADALLATAAVAILVRRGDGDRATRWHRGVGGLLMATMMAMMVAPVGAGASASTSASMPGMSGMPGMPGMSMPGMAAGGVASDGTSHGLVVLALTAAVAYVAWSVALVWRMHRRRGPRLAVWEHVTMTVAMGSMMAAMV